MQSRQSTPNETFYGVIYSNLLCVCLKKKTHDLKYKQTLYLNSFLRPELIVLYFDRQPLLLPLPLPLFLPLILLLFLHFVVPIPIHFVVPLLLVLHQFIRNQHLQQLATVRQQSNLPAFT